jgi:tRNA 5-methylaminomethyl-2-thiouridine biosynthesis bifunctional protein
MPTFQQHAQIDWDEQGRPHSRQYDDVYFSRKVASTKPCMCSSSRTACVNASPNCRRRLPGDRRDRLRHRAEFFCAWQLFDELAHADARLHFVSVEKYPDP